VGNQQQLFCIRVVGELNYIFKSSRWARGDKVRGDVATRRRVRGDMEKGVGRRATSENLKMKKHH
jgi:hypothetical protein